MKNFIVQIKLLFLSNTVKQKYNFPREINAKMKFRSHDMKLILYPRFSDSLSSLLTLTPPREKRGTGAHFRFPWTKLIGGKKLEKIRFNEIVLLIICISYF